MATLGFRMQRTGWLSLERSRGEILRGVGGGFWTGQLATRDSAYHFGVAPFTVETVHSRQVGVDVVRLKLCAQRFVERQLSTTTRD